MNTVVINFSYPLPSWVLNKLTRKFKRTIVFTIIVNQLSCSKIDSSLKEKIITYLNINSTTLNTLTLNSYNWDSKNRCNVDLEVTLSNIPTWLRYGSKTLMRHDIQEALSLVNER